jgi:hypothetical protein
MKLHFAGSNTASLISTSLSSEKRIFFVLFSSCLQIRVSFAKTEREEILTVLLAFRLVFSIANFYTIMSIPPACQLVPVVAAAH